MKLLRKKTFCQAIRAIQEQAKIDEEIGNALEKVCGSYVTFNTENKRYIALQKVLEDVMEDNDDIIDWWLWDGSDKVVTNNKKEIRLDTPEQLYDFLVETYD